MTAVSGFARTTAAAPRAVAERGLLARIMLPANGLRFFTWAVAVTYGVIPLAVYFFAIPSPYYLQLAGLTAIAVVGLLLGGALPLFDSRFSPDAPAFKLPPAVFHVGVWTTFLVFLVVTFSTAQTIPVLSALQGASPDDLSWERGLFLKGRTGAGIILLYASTLLTSTLLPYSTVHLYLKRHPLRHRCALIFFIFCVSFMQKTLFMTVALPLITFLAITQQLNVRRLLIGTAIVVGVILLQMYLSLDSEVLATTSAGSSVSDYLAADYIARDPLMYMLWRAVAVPIFTAVDTLIVHDLYFRGVPLLGATSTLLAALFGQERVNLERFVAEYQFGGWNDIANSNAVYISDAYANFGLVGVLLISVFIGQAFRWFRLSRDVGFASLWSLFALSVFNASIIGTLFSNGYLYMFAHGLMVQLKSQKGYE
jgi:hypothetical protein